MLKKSTFFYVFTVKIPNILSHFFNFFLTFFQISSRTWGINFDTIACVFELVDGQKISYFSIFFQKIIFQNIFFWAYPCLSYPQKWSKKYLKISYPTLSRRWRWPGNSYFKCFSVILGSPLGHLKMAI